MSPRTLLPVGQVYYQTFYSLRSRKDEVLYFHSTIGISGPCNTLTRLLYARGKRFTNGTQTFFIIHQDLRKRRFLKALILNLPRKHTP